MFMNFFSYFFFLPILIFTEHSLARKISANQTGIIDSDDEVYNIIKLRDFLLTNPRYDRLARPVKHHSTTVQVSVALFLSKITELEISTGILTVQASLLLKWKDEHLVWDPDKFGGITKLVFGFREIWTPEITHWSSFDSKSYIAKTFDRQSIDVKSDGTVEWFPTATLKSHCPLDLKDFPTDTQTCHQSVGTWNQNTSEVNLVEDSEYMSDTEGIHGPMFVSKRFRSQEWDPVILYMERYEVHGEVAKDNFSAFDIGYTLKRKTSIYTCYVFLPYLVASFLFLASFPLPIQSALRLVFGGIAVILLIMLSFFLGIVLGNHSLEVPYSLKCIAVNLFLVSICLAWNQTCCSFLANIPDRFSNPPACLLKIITNRYVSKIFCIWRKDTEMLLESKFGEKRNETDGGSSSTTTSGVLTSFPTMDRSSPQPVPSTVSSLNVTGIQSSTRKKVNGERELNTKEGEADGEDRQQEKVFIQNLTSFTETQYPVSSSRSHPNESWTLLFSLLDKILLLVYLVTLLVFHS